MYLELLARIVLSFSICPVVLHLLFSIRFCPNVDLSFCSLRVVCLHARCDRMSIRHLLSFRVPWAHPLHLAQLELCSSPPLALTRRLFVCIHPCLSVKVLSTNRSDLSRGSLLCDGSLFHAGGAQPGQFSSVTVSLDVLGNGGPTPLTFFVNFNVVATICHGVPHKPLQFVTSHGSLSVCLVQLLTTHNSTLGNTQNCSCSIIMTKDSLSHAARE